MPLRNLLHRKDLSLLAANIDLDFYCKAVGESLTPLQAARHFLLQNRNFAFDPTPDFSIKGYLEANEDIRRSDSNPYVHFLRYGKVEGRGGWNPRETAVIAPAVVRQEPVLSVERAELIEKHIIAQTFDEDYYRHRYGDLYGKDIDLADHYHRYGDREGRQPSPFFDPNYYRKKVKGPVENALIHYSVVGKGQHIPGSNVDVGEPVFDRACEAIGIDREAGAAALRERYYSRRQRAVSGELGEMIRKAIAIDPLIAHGMKSQINDMAVAPFRSRLQMEIVGAFHSLQEQANWSRAKVVVLVPWIHLGGASRLTGWYLNAVSKVFGEENVVVINTETSEYEYMHWFPQNCRYVDFAQTCATIPAEKRKRILFEYIRSLTPEYTININSKLFWDVVSDFGKQLADHTKIQCYFFCNEKDQMGNWSGYPVRKFHYVFPLFHAVMTDSAALRAELMDRFMIPEGVAGRIHHLDTPTDIELAAAARPQPGAERTGKIFWAGRLDRQKRVDLVYAIARKLPEVEFHLWGSSQLDKSLIRSLGMAPANIIRHDPYKSLAELPFEDCDLWLYTSEWDGVPNMLIEIATLAVPLVGSISGGTGEILQPGLAGGVSDIEDIDEYVRLIRWILDNPELAQKRADNLREMVLTRHNPDVYKEQVAAVLEG